MCVREREINTREERCLGKVDREGCNYNKVTGENVTKK